MTFSTNQVAEAAQVTLRQLQWWDERNVVPVGISGHRRQYDRQRLLKTMLVAQMRRKGLSLQRTRRVLGTLNVAHLEKNPQAFLIIRGVRYSIAYDFHLALKEIAAQDGPVHVVAIAPLIETLNKQRVTQ